VKKPLARDPESCQAIIDMQPKIDVRVNNDYLKINFIDRRYTIRKLKQGQSPKIILEVQSDVRKGTLFH
jgi:hypothetical protein